MRHEDAYREYVSECLRMMSGNTAKFAGGEYMPLKLNDITDPEPEEEEVEEDNRTAVEFAADIWKRMTKKKGG